MWHIFFLYSSIIYVHLLLKAASNNYFLEVCQNIYLFSGYRRGRAGNEISLDRSLINHLFEQGNYIRIRGA